MFVWDFLASLVLDQIIDWLYNAVVGFLGDFFALMGQMGAELFDLPWVEAVTAFFGNFAWALYITGIVVAGFECAIEAQNGRGDIKGVCLNVLKGFFAVNLFNIVPIRLYQFCISLQATFASDLAGISVHTGFGDTAAEVLQTINNAALNANPIVNIFVVIMMGYAVIKIFFANLKRGGIMVIQIAVGSLFLFSVPRGYVDGFMGWCKQVIGLCLTAFLQATLLIVGLLVMRDHKLLGLGIMLSATEIPRVANQFGLETGTRANIAGAIYTTQSVINLTKTVAAVVK
ncbi:DUF6045 family protein [Ruminococcaceae bacterium OttesenSCG-928-L11]|nr:DUF6045 family protein [Ruminococcaceae bacterium OttesenSCG-928-L11]